MVACLSFFLNLYRFFFLSAMKHIISILLLAAFVLLPSSSSAQILVNGVGVSEASMDRSGENMVVTVKFDMSALKVRKNRAVILTPYLTNGTDSVALKTIGVYGRKRYLSYIRNDVHILTDNPMTSFRSHLVPQRLTYRDVTDYEPWMESATLMLDRREFGCCEHVVGNDVAVLDVRKPEVVKVPAQIVPQMVYVRPEAEVRKSRQIEGTAYIDFPVNRTEINPTYRRNEVELAKIRATIDSVRYDNDITINQVWLKGYASPESPYTHNRDLAIGRTQALKDYIQRFYRFSPGVISTDFEPEDWAGLRRFVEGSDMQNRSQLLAIIDSDRDPDTREWILKTSYPKDYQFLFQECYPALRHTDYRISYTIRGYDSTDEIRAVLAKRPQNLSLNEFYLVAQQLEPGSEAFADIFETAVRMYPDDPVANLNAASVALRRGELQRAERHLLKAGDSAEAVYNRGVLAFMLGDEASAVALFKAAADRGLEAAKDMLRQMQR